jgi:hypothetical protein
VVISALPDVYLKLRKARRGALRRRVGRAVHAGGRALRPNPA